MILARVITLLDYIPQGFALLGFAVSACLLCGLVVSSPRPDFVRKWGVVFAVSVLVGSLGLLWHFRGKKQIAEANRRMLANREIYRIEAAAFNYFMKVGSWPRADNVTVVRLLIGDGGEEPNLPGGNLRLSDEGAALDPWGSPYYLRISEEEGLKARSAGPDRIEGTIDDYPPTKGY